MPDRCIRFLRHAEGRFKAGDRLGPAEWPHYDLLFVHRGQLELEFPGLKRTLSLSVGEGVMILPRTAFHGRVITAQARISIQHFALRGAVRGVLRAIARRRSGILTQLPGRAAPVEILVAYAVALGREPSSALLTAMRCALLEFLVAEAFLWSAAAGAKPLRIDSAKLTAWARDHLRERPGVDDLARISGLSPSRFRAIFSAEGGSTAGALLRTCRLREGKRLLTETEQTLKEISRAVGYSDAVAFHRAFRSGTGITPAVYRQAHRMFG